MTDKEEITRMIRERKAQHLKDDGGAGFSTSDSAMAHEDEEILSYIDSMGPKRWKDWDATVDRALEELSVDRDEEPVMAAQLEDLFGRFYELGKNDMC